MLCGGSGGGGRTRRGGGCTPLGGMEGRGVHVRSSVLAAKIWLYRVSRDGEGCRRGGAYPPASHLAVIHYHVTLVPRGRTLAINEKLGSFFSKELFRFVVVPSCRARVWVVEGAVIVRVHSPFLP